MLSPMQISAHPFPHMSAQTSKAPLSMLVYISIDLQELYRARVKNSNTHSQDQYPLLDL